jgi:hypothetical protein
MKPLRTVNAGMKSLHVIKTFFVAKFDFRYHKAQIFMQISKPLKKSKK